MSLQSQTLTTTTANVYTSSGETVVTPIYLCNYSGSTATVNVFAVSSGVGVASTTNMIYNNLQITAGDTYVIDKEKLILASGDFLAANCSANTAVSMTISYSSI